MKSIAEQSELLLKSHIINVFDHVINTRFSIEQRLMTTESIVGDVVRARVGIVLPDSKTEVLWLRVAVFTTSGNIMFNTNDDQDQDQDQAIKVVRVSVDSEEELTEAIADVFSGFIEAMKSSIHAIN